MLPTLDTNSQDAYVRLCSTAETLHSGDEVAALADEWNRLSEEATAPNVFTTYDWFRLWTAQHAKEEAPRHLLPHVVVLRENGRVSGIAPLARRTVRRFVDMRKLGFATHHSDYNDLLVGAGNAMQLSALAEHLARTAGEWELMDLRELRDAGSGTAGLERALERAGLMYRVFPEGEGCPYMPITGDAKATLHRLSGHVRRVLRRRGEKAEEMGLRIRIVEHPENEPELIKTMTLLDAKKQAHRDSDMFAGKYPALFQKLFDVLGPRGWLYVALVEIEGKPVAFQFGFRCGRKLWDYTKAYDRTHARFAPGTLLLLPLLDYCHTHGLDEYDFLRGEEEYKMAWTETCHRRARVVVWNRRWLSRLCASLYMRARVSPVLSMPSSAPSDTTVE